MKRLIILSLALVTGLSISSCKKGENDPALSLKSRNARITGEWALTNISGDFFTKWENSDGTVNTYKQSVTFDDGKITVTDEDGSTGTFDYTLNLTMDDNQDLQIYNYFSDGVDFEEYDHQDQWYWLDGVKKKTQINLPGFSEITFFSFDDALVLDRLTNKELHLKIDTKSFMDDSYFGEEGQEYSLLLEFEKQ